MGENFFPCEFAPDPAINETATTTTRRYTVFSPPHLFSSPILHLISLPQVVKIHTDVSRAPDPELVQMRSNVWLETTWIDSQTDATGVTLFWVNLSLALGLPFLTPLSSFHFFSPFRPLHGRRLRALRPRGRHR